ncbi:MAG: hypothetical protein WD187_04000 [Candidatus Woykebacteria bacterium]
MVIEQDGFATIEGTRVRVKDIADQYQRGLDEIVAEKLQDYFPHRSIE